MNGALDNRASLALAAPEILLALGCLAVLVLGLVRPQRVRGPAALLSVLVLLAAVAATLYTRPATAQGLFGGLLARDAFGDFFRLLAPLAATVVAALAVRARDTLDDPPGPGRSVGASAPAAGAADAAPEFFALLLAAVLGVNLMAGATDLLLAYLGLELVSLMSYVLTGFTRGSRRSAEAALKYVIYGGVASGAFLYGLSLLYGFAASTDLAAIRAAIAAAPAPLAMAAVALCLAGLGYKVAVVPFHAWCPDVYQGAPTPVAAFLSVAPKAGGFALLLRFFGATAEGAGGSAWTMLALVIAVVTMTLGNLGALGQPNIKRLLAYSSIAHAGYLFLGVAVGTPEGHRAILLYLAFYLFMNLGAFAVVVAVGVEEIEEWAGLGRRRPLAAFCMTVALVALAGLPPTVGFVGKYYLFAAVVARGRELGEGMFFLAALLAVLNSVVSLYYYARVVRAMYLEAPRAAQEPAPPPARGLAPLLVLLLVPTLLLGIYWTPLDRFTARSLQRWNPPPGLSVR